MHSMKALLFNLYRGRYIIKNMLIKDIKSRYAGSLLGPVWNILNPLFYIALYTLVFSTILNVRFSQTGGSSSFVVYFLAGFIPWLFFQEAVSRGSSVFLENAHIIKKVDFPIEVCVMTALFSSMVTFIIYLTLFTGYILIAGELRPLSLPLILIPFFIQVLLILGISFGLGSIAVFFRDMTQIVPLALTAFFFLTPIVYPAEAIPEKMRWFFTLNPFYWITEMYRTIITRGVLPEWGHCLYILILSVIIFLTGFFVFNKTKAVFRDIL